jgi:REP element-mobilizing transposase RayT
MMKEQKDKELEKVAGQLKGDFVSQTDDQLEPDLSETLLQEEEFWRPPTRFRALAESSTGVPPVRTSRSVPSVAADHGRDANATLNIRHGARLPHWTMDGATYFVTFRLGDSLPKAVLDAWLSEREKIEMKAKQAGRPLSADEEKRLNYLHSEKVGKYLDAGHGACWMKDDRIAGLVANALMYFDGDRYELGAWCVMPNHIHVVVMPRTGHILPDILHSWKSFSAHEANKLLRRRGQFWEEEYYDHLVRDEADFRRCIEYTLANPGRAGLKDWKWVSSTGVPPVKTSRSVPTVKGNHGRDAHATIHGRIPRTSGS